LTFTYDTTTDRGRVRLLCRDTVEAAAVYEDEEIDAFLALGSGQVLLAAAFALENLAAAETLVQKRIKLLDLQTDGPAEAEALTALAKALRTQYTAMPAFDVAQMVVDGPSYLQRLYDEALSEA
jgi:hypothetical protein